jgi:hypothetical protein
MEEVERITFIIGDKAEVPAKLDHHPPKSYVFVVGDCTNKNQARGILRPGCASTSMHRTFFPGKNSEEVLDNYRFRRGEVRDFRALSAPPLSAIPSLSSKPKAPDPFPSATRYKDGKGQLIPILDLRFQSIERPDVSAIHQNGGAFCWGKIILDKSL